MDKVIKYSPGLVLERKRSQKIIINGDIIISVDDVIGGRVKLRIIAPEGISVNREEVQIKKDKERNKDAN